MYLIHETNIKNQEVAPPGSRCTNSPAQLTPGSHTPVGNLNTLGQYFTRWQRWRWVLEVFNDLQKMSTSCLLSWERLWL